MTPEDRLRDAAQAMLDREEALHKLLAAYRLGGRTPEKALDTLERTREAPATLRAVLRSTGMSDLPAAALAVIEAWRRVDHVVYSVLSDGMDEDDLLAAGLTLDAPMDALRAALRSTPAAPKEDGYVEGWDAAVGVAVLGGGGLCSPSGHTDHNPGDCEFATLRSTPAAHQPDTRCRDCGRTISAFVTHAPDCEEPGARAEGVDR